MKKIALFSSCALFSFLNNTTVCVCVWTNIRFVRLYKMIIEISRQSRPGWYQLMTHAHTHTRVRQQLVCLLVSQMKNVACFSSRSRRRGWGEKRLLEKNNCVERIADNSDRSCTQTAKRSILWLYAGRRCLSHPHCFSTSLSLSFFLGVECISTKVAAEDRCNQNTRLNHDDNNNNKEAREREKERRWWRGRYRCPTKT